MTESEQAKAALAALAEGESERCEGLSDEQTEGARGETDPLGRERGAHRPTSETAQERGDVFEWGPDETASQADSERADVSADYRAVIERAQAATEDIEVAAAFVESGGLERLEQAVTQAEREVSGLAEDGRAALATFERFRAAAAESVTEE